MDRISYQIYLFQLENYHIRRYFGLLSKALSAFWVREHRAKIVWTLKLKVLTALAVLFVLFAAAVASGLHTMKLFLLSIVVFMFFFPIFLVLAEIVIAIPEFFVKRTIVNRAARKLRSFAGLKVVGIAGSYGKTTMKEVIANVLSERYRVVKTPETVNTPLGIARLIESSIDAKTEVFVVEMGEHVPGDVRALCKIVRPHVGIVTGVNEAHLERMGGIDATVAAVFELAASPGLEHLVLNVDDPLVFKNYERFVDRKFVSFYSAEGHPPCDIFVRGLKFHEDGTGQSFELEKNGKLIGRFGTALLGDYAPGTAIAALLVGEAFGLDPEAVARGVAKTAPPPHRLALVPTTNGVTVIDDGFNGNPAGARAAMRVLNKFPGRRRIYVTPGLVEMGEASDAVHEALGKELASAADLVVLIKTSATAPLVKGLKEAGFKSERIITFRSATKAHAEIGNLVRPGDVVLFQNDWPDNYS